MRNKHHKSSVEQHNSINNNKI